MEMDWSHGSGRMIETSETSAGRGKVTWSPVKSIWLSAMTIVAVIAGPFLVSWSAFAVFILLTGITLCAGHSVGMHRRFIHNSFECPLWLEYVMVWLGVLVGMAGPFGMMRQHDLRDWAQRRKDCHPYLCHGQSIWKDAWWQLHCDLQLEQGPEFRPEPRLAADRVYAWMERYWMWQQLPLAIILFALGGWSFVVWGVCARVSVSVIGHWLVGWFAHNEGPMRWRVVGAGVQGHDVPIAALLSMGESWHNNHHAYPGSARLGLNSDQPDPGWWMILVLERMGLVWDIKTPETLPHRDALQRMSEDDGGCPLLKRLIRQAPSH